MDSFERLRDTLGVWQMQEKLAENIAKNIKARRREMGMTQQTLAGLLDTKQPDIARMERKGYGRFHTHRLAKVAYFLKTTPEKLVAPPKKPKRST